LIALFFPFFVSTLLTNSLGEGHFDDGSAKPSATATPMDSDAAVSGPKRGPRGGRSKKAKTTKQRLAIIDGSGEV
jgi:chromatin-remodeling ATPase INO80